MGGRGDARVSGGVAGGDRVGAPRQDNVDPGFRQLKVEDALAYLEQVKSQFNNHPNVYNQFLDIMKEFKAQTIDTAEVIRRVSTLFEGRKELILGFNTFLPPGYKIELRGDPTAGGVTGFSSPGGVFCPLGEEGPQPQAELQPAPPPPPPPLPLDASTQHGVPHASQRAQSRQTRATHGQNHLQRPDSAYDQAVFMDPMHETDEKLPPDNIGPSQSPQHPLGVAIDARAKLPPSASVTNDPAATLAGGFASPGTNAVALGKPIEFDQAVTYVNKIKSRFSDDELVYKNFLDILQTYQKEQKSIKEVYKQVSRLFRDHSDLLDEFSHFLPEQPPQAQRLVAGNLKSTAETVRVKSQVSRGVKQQPVLEGGIQEHQGGASYSATNWKGKDKSAKGSGKSKAGKSSSTTPGPSGGIAKQGGGASRRGSGAPDGSKKGRRGTSNKKTLLDAKPAVPADSSPGGSGPVTKAPCPELEFFEELRSLLGDEGQQSYSEFIKCLSLFSQEIICGDELMRLADGLLNHRKPLTEAFRAFLDQTDPKATQSAVAILRRARNAGDGSSAAAAGTKTTPAAPVVSSSAVRDRLRDLPTLAGIHVEGHKQTAAGGSRSPKVNPLYKGRPLSEIGRDHGTAIADSKSYVTLPSDLGSIQSSGMTADDRSVLNHMCVSRAKAGSMKLLASDPASRQGPARSSGLRPPSGAKNSLSGGSGVPFASDTPSSPRTVRNGFGKTTPLGIEDQRVDLEMLITRAENAVSKLERLVKGDIRSVSSLTTVDLKPISLIYRESSIDIIEVLRSTPIVTAPVVLRRLKQRLADWKVSQKRVEQVWKSKRFSLGDGQGDHPLTWQRSELVAELMNPAPPQGGKMILESPNGEAAANAKRTTPSSGRKQVVLDLVGNDDNIEHVCDLLWFMFEWEADSAQQADIALEFLERVYKQVQKAAESELALFADDYLYVLTRLLAEASQRIGYILEHNYDGVAVDSVVRKLKEVLSGNIALSAYDEHCKQIYGEGRRWETLLCDLPLILKRLCSVVLKVSSRQLSKDLLAVEDGNGNVDEENDETSRNGKLDDMDVDGRETAADDSVKDSETRGDALDKNTTKRLRKAMALTSSASRELFKITVSKEALSSDKEWIEARNLKKPGERGLVVCFQHLPKETAAQFRHLDLDKKMSNSDLRQSSFMKHINRAKKKERRLRWKRPGNSDEVANVLREDGLGVRLNEENGHLFYVCGTEDFFMRKRRKCKSEEAVSNKAKTLVPVGPSMETGTGGRPEAEAMVTA